jgi:oligoribonuclease (3'-5' exoribonuclease)
MEKKCNLLDYDFFFFLIKHIPKLYSQTLKSFYRRSHVKPCVLVEKSIKLQQTLEIQLLKFLNNITTKIKTSPKLGNSTSNDFESFINPFHYKNYKDRYGN